MRVGKGLQSKIKKIRQTKGFSLVELLAATLILLLVTSIVAQGIPLAQRAYKRSVDLANAQLLLSTAITILRDDLGMANNITFQGAEATENGGPTLQYSNARSGVKRISAKMKVVGSIPDNSDDNVLHNYDIKMLNTVPVLVDKKTSDTDVGNTTLADALGISWALSEKQGLYLSFDSISVDDSGIISIHNLKVIKDGYDEPLAQVGGN